MSLIRKIALFVLPVVALAFPLSAVSSAAPHPDHHDHFDHHEHFEHHDVFFHHDPIVNLRLAPLVVNVPPVQVMYRVGPAAPWYVYGNYGDVGSAQVVANSLQIQGYQIVIR